MRHSCPQMNDFPPTNWLMSNSSACETEAFLTKNQTSYTKLCSLGTKVWFASAIPWEEKKPMMWLFHSTSSNEVVPPILWRVELPLKAGLAILGVRDQLIFVPVGEQEEQMKYPGLVSAYPL